jgi:hypothetical protein
VTKAEGIPLKQNGRAVFTPARPQLLKQQHWQIRDKAFANAA